jgi:tRNA threonylcarbamoyladenosine biosynthesis protein TsaB
LLLYANTTSRQIERQSKLSRKGIEVNKHAVLLGLDCTGDTFSLALCSPTETLAEHCGGKPREHLTELFPRLETMLTQANLKASDLAGVAVTTGPGSFTGVRLGVLIARTFALVLKLPLYQVDALEALACNAGQINTPLVVALDARKGEVLSARFLMVDGKPQLLEPGELFEPERWAAGLPRPCTVLGNALPAYGKLLHDLTVLGPEFALVQARHVARLGWRAARMGHKVSWAQLKPDYVRPASVQVQTA